MIDSYSSKSTSHQSYLLFPVILPNWWFSFRGLEAIDDQFKYTSLYRLSK